VILLVCAVPAELAWLDERAGVETLVAGIGPVEAAARVARALARRPYDVVLDAGIAGAFRGTFSVGDGVVVFEERIEIDRENGEAILAAEGSHIEDRARADAALVDAIAALGFPQARGITVARATCTEATARRLRAVGAQIESMEGFAVLRAAEIAGVPAIELRGISNYAGDRDASEWDIAAGLGGLRRIVNATLDLLHTAPAHAD
jgi:futalosine hydrolase